MAIVLITGAAAGLGRSTALAFARQGHTVYASMRNTADGQELVKTAEHEKLVIRPVELDVTNNTSTKSALEQITRDVGRLDILVNNAGIHIPGALEDMPEDDIHRVMDTNFFGALNVTRSVLPVMRTQGSGRIIMLSSVGAMIGRVTDSIYCASKSALEAAAEALRFEVARFGIRVSVVEPGVFRTEIGHKYNVSADYPEDSPYRQLVDFRVDMVKESCKKGDDPEKVAALIVGICGIEEPGFRYAAGEQARAFLPELKKMSETERENLIRSAAGIDWWLEGKSKPD